MILPVMLRIAEDRIHGAVLLVRAVESSRTPAWSDADAAAVSAEARRIEGEHAPFERLVARRAELAAARLVKRDPKLAALLDATAPHGWLAWTLLAAAFAIGVATDAIGPSGRINILAPPLLVVLAWNLAVYAVLLLRLPGALRADTALGPLRRWLLRLHLSAHAGPRDAKRDDGSVAFRYLHDWAAASRPLHTARAAAVLHGAAAVLAAGALVSLYARGIAFEFRAGWESTFLQAGDVGRILGLVLGPAAALGGIPLPGTDELARLRFSAGPGENAARWIHLYAITVGLAVVVPRLALAAAALGRAHVLARSFPLPLDDGYFQRLRRAMSGASIDVMVLPYSYHLAQDAVAGLRAALERELGTGVNLSMADPVPAGEEDGTAARLVSREAADATPAAAGSVVATLFALAATPERETHGAVVQAVAAARPAGRTIVLVDESTFRRRFTGAEGAGRLAQRRTAWQRMLAEVGAEPTFIDTGATPAQDTGPAAEPAPRSAERA
jgi:hypothetical protein